MMSCYLFKTKFKTDEKFNAKVIQNSGIWYYDAKGYWDHKPFLSLPNFTFQLPFTKRWYFCKKRLHY